MVIRRRIIIEDEDILAPTDAPQLYPFKEEESKIIPEEDKTTDKYIPEEVSPTSSRIPIEEKGRSWPDLIYPYSSNPKYLYLVILLITFIAFGASGNLKTINDLLMSGLVILISWIVLLFTLRKR